MKKVYTTFSGERFHDTTKLIVEEAPKFGADEVLVYDNYWALTTHPTYRYDAEWLLLHPRTRAVGWLLWKPLIILDALRRVGPDDVVFYTDGDTYPIAPLDPFFNTTAKDRIMLFRANGWPRAAVWTKHEMFIAMGLDNERYWSCHCAVGRFMGFTRDYIPLLEEWYSWCRSPQVNTFDLDPAVKQLDGFRENRTEQACLGLLAERERIRLYREADEFGDTKDDTGDDLLDRDLYPRSFTQIWGNSYAPGHSYHNPGVGSVFRNVHDVA